MFELQDPHVESYRMEDITQHLKLDRDRLIGLAILLGCDYLPKGIAGIGREQAMKLIAALDDKHSLLKRYRHECFSYCVAKYELTSSSDVALRFI